MAADGVQPLLWFGSDEQVSLYDSLQAASKAWPAAQQAQLDKCLALLSRQAASLKAQVELQEKQVAEVMPGLAATRLPDPPTQHHPSSSTPSTTTAREPQQAAASSSNPSASSVGPLLPSLTSAAALKRDAAALQALGGGEEEPPVRPETEQLLLALFACTDTPSREEVRALAAQAGLPEHQIRDAFNKMKNSVRSVLARLQKKAARVQRQQFKALGLSLMPAPSATGPIDLAAAAAAGNGITIGDGPSTSYSNGTNGLASAGLSSPVNGHAAAWMDANNINGLLDKLSAMLDEAGGLSSPRYAGTLLLQMQQAGCAEVRLAQLRAIATTHNIPVLMALVSTKMLDLLSSWTKEAEADGQISILRLLLAVLAKLPISTPLLQASQLPRTLVKLTKHAHPKVSGAAAAVLQQWLGYKPTAATSLPKSGPAISSGPGAGQQPWRYPQPTSTLPATSSSAAAASSSVAQLLRRPGGLAAPPPGSIFTFSMPAAASAQAGTAGAPPLPAGPPPKARPLTADEIIRAKQKQKAARSTQAAGLLPCAGAKKQALGPTGTGPSTSLPPSAHPTAHPASTGGGSSAGGTLSSSRQVPPQQQMEQAVAAYNAAAVKWAAARGAKEADSAALWCLVRSRLPALQAAAQWYTPPAVQLDSASDVAAGQC